MGLRNLRNADLTEEIERVKRHIDLAVYELTEARGRMSSQKSNQPGDSLSEASESELANVCISLELSLADTVVWAQKLADRVRGGAGAVGAVSHDAVR